MFPRNSEKESFGQCDDFISFFFKVSCKLHSYLITSEADKITLMEGSKRNNREREKIIGKKNWVHEKEIKIDLQVCFKLFVKLGRIIIDKIKQENSSKNSFYLQKQMS